MAVIDLCAALWAQVKETPPSWGSVSAQHLPGSLSCPGEVSYW